MVKDIIRIINPNILHIVSLLKKNGKMNIVEVSKKCDFPISEISKHLKLLLKMNIIEKKQGRLHITYSVNQYAFNDLAIEVMRSFAINLQFTLKKNSQAQNKKKISEDYSKYYEIKKENHESITIKPRD